MNEKQYYVYIMTTKSNTALYTGVTNDLQRRVLEHRSGKGGLFTKKYKIYKLVYYEIGDDIRSAIVREKQNKSWLKNEENCLD
jgi:putative endonuclease